MAPNSRAGVWLVVLVVVPTLATMMLLSRPKVGKGAIALQNKCMIGAGVVGLIALGDWLRDRKGRGATFAMITWGSCGMIVLLVFWNKLFRGYIESSGFTANTFRGIFHTIYAPLYGRVQFAKFSLWVVGIALLGAGLLWEASRARPAVWRIALVMVGLIVCFAGTDSSLRVRGYFAEYQSFESDLAKFAGVNDVMRNYVSRMPQLSHYDSHYPPGFLVMFMIGKGMGTALFVKALAVLLPAMVVLVVYALARELGATERAGALAALLVASSGGILIFPTITPTAAMAFLAAMCLWLLLRAIRSGEWWVASLFGLCFAVYFFFSFASYMLAILMGMVLLAGLVNRSIPLVRMARVMAIGVGTFAVFYAILFLIWRFDIVACFRMAREMHLKEPGHGFDDPVRYLFRSTGGILAYWISASFVVGILAIASVRSGDGLWRAFAWGTLLGILGSAFSGMSFLETERIWLIFTPALAVLAGAELEKRSDREGKWVAVGVILFALTFSCAYELVMRHHFSG